MIYKLADTLLAETVSAQGSKTEKFINTFITLSVFNRLEPDHLTVWLLNFKQRVCNSESLNIQHIR
jgi:hypothetical protein